MIVVSIVLTNDLTNVYNCPNRKILDLSRVLVHCYSNNLQCAAILSQSELPESIWKFKEII